MLRSQTRAVTVPSAARLASVPLGLAALLAATLAAAPAPAQTPAPATPQTPQVTPAPTPSTPFEMPRADDAAPGGAAPTPSPLEELMENIFSRAQPHLEGLARDMGGLVEEYSPMFEELGGLIDDIQNYELPPERQSNGDILIRRKADAPPPPPLTELPQLLERGQTPEQGGAAPPAPGDGTPLVTPPAGSTVDL